MLTCTNSSGFCLFSIKTIFPLSISLDCNRASSPINEKSLHLSFSFSGEVETCSSNQVASLCFYVQYYLSTLLCDAPPLSVCHFDRHTHAEQRSTADRINLLVFTQMLPLWAHPTEPCIGGCMLIFALEYIHLETLSHNI